MGRGVLLCIRPRTEAIFEVDAKIFYGLGRELGLHPVVHGAGQPGAGIGCAQLTWVTRITQGYLGVRSLHLGETDRAGKLERVAPVLRHALKRALSQASTGVGAKQMSTSIHCVNGLTSRALTGITR